MADMEETLMLAAGKQTRWNHLPNLEYPIKQLIKINGETLINNIYSDFPDAVCISKDKNILENYKGKTMIPEENKTIIHTLNSMLNTQSRVMVLLGDVSYGKDTVERIKNCTDDLMFFGTNVEIFAVVFSQIEKIKATCRKLLKTSQEVKLWHLYRVLSNIHINRHRIKENFTMVEDTRDWDYKEQYLHYNGNR